MTAQTPPAKVNLLPTDQFEFSKLGRFLKWALSTGRYVVVLTELLVIMAFLSRFWFDRRLTDLRELRMQKAAIVDSFEEVQRQFEETKVRLAKARELIESQYNPAGRLSEIQSLTPAGIEYESIEITNEETGLGGFAPSSTVFSVLLTLLQQEAEDLGQSGVEVRRLEQSEDRFPGFDFELVIAEAKPTVTGEEVDLDAAAEPAEEPAEEPAAE